MAYKNYYEILEVKDNCTIHDIKRSYHKLALKHHPDRNNDTNGDEFNVRPGGTKIERQKIYSDCLDNFKYKGKRLYVKYFELTDRGIPRFPTTKTTCVETYIRDIIE